MHKNHSFVKKDDKQSGRKCCGDREVLETKFNQKNSEKRKKSKLNAVNSSVRCMKVNESMDFDNKKSQRNESRSKSRKRSRSQDFSRSFDNQKASQYGDVFKQAKKLLAENYGTNPNRSNIKSSASKKFDNDDRADFIRRVY